MAGVRPVDEDAMALDTGPGSEKRTFFLGLVGVFAEAEVAPAEELDFCGLEASSPSTKLLVRRRFRRTASGRSSTTSDSTGWALILTIFALHYLCPAGSRRTEDWILWKMSRQVGVVNRNATSRNDRKCGEKARHEVMGTRNKQTIERKWKDSTHRTCVAVTSEAQAAAVG